MAAFVAFRLRRGLSALGLLGNRAAVSGERHARLGRANLCYGREEDLGGIRCHCASDSLRPGALDSSMVPRSAEHGVESFQRSVGLRSSCQIKFAGGYMLIIGWVFLGIQAAIVIARLLGYGIFTARRGLLPRGGPHT